MDTFVRILWGLGGMVFLMGLAWCFSTNRRRVQWRVVVWGCVLQLGFAALILKTPPGRWLFEFARDLIAQLLGFTDAGAGFLFGNLYKGAGHLGPYQVYDSSQGMNVEIGIVFAFHVLMTIVFFGSLMSILYHVGVMQWLVTGVARVMRFFMRTSGAETLSCAANIFVGQTEAPLVVKPYLERMTRSEIMAVMTGGFATVAGGVMAAYARFGIDPGHLLAASVMSAPAGLIFAKLLYPEEETPETSGEMQVKFEKTSANVLDAAANGASDGMKLAINVAAMLMAFIALIAMIDWGLGKLQLLPLLLSRGVIAGGASVAIGFASARKLKWPIAATIVIFLVIVERILATNPANLSLAGILGYVGYPIALAMGVSPKDAMAVGQIIGIKTGVNEFVGYIRLSDMREMISPRSFDLATYALCGFSNFSSIAIQIGGISALVPGRRQDLARIGLRAMIAGSLACFQTAAIAGIFISEEESAARRTTFEAAWMKSELSYQAKIDSHEKLSADYPDSVFADQARTRVAALRSEARETFIKMQATARRLWDEGKRDEAVAVYRRVVDEYTTAERVAQYHAAKDPVEVLSHEDPAAARDRLKDLVEKYARANKKVKDQDLLDALDKSDAIEDIKKANEIRWRIIDTYALEEHWQLADVVVRNGVLTERSQ